MSILVCGLDSAPGSVSSSIGSDYQIDTQRRFLVIADPTDDETYVRANFGLGLTPPAGLYKPHPTEPFTRCKNVNASYQSHVIHNGSRANKWSVTATFGFLNTEQILSAGAISGDPTECQLEVSIEGIEQQRPCDIDVDGKIVANSAGQPYDPPVMLDEVRCMIRIARNEKLLSPAQILSFANKINLNPWQGFAPKTCKMLCPRVVPKYSPFLNVLYYRVEYQIEHNPRGWAEKVLDAGYQWLDKSTTPAKLRQILDAQGLTLTSPALLDGTGKPLKLPAAPADIIYNTHNKYYTADFDILDFPANILVTVPFL
jgi:hypothetical protein